VYVCSAQASLPDAACCMRIIHSNSHPETVVHNQPWVRII